MNVIAIIQARMGSSRRPSKVLAKIQGVPMLQHVLSRVEICDGLSKIVVATTENSEDDPLVEWCKSKNINVFRGSSENVLSRFYHCALDFKADVIVRITADDPLKDPHVIDLAINTLIQDETLDYVSNTIDPSYPEGIDVEVFRYRALEIAHKSAYKKIDQEHVTPYIWSNPGVFKIHNFYAKEDTSEFRLTVDYEDDLEVVSAILSHFKGNQYVGYEEIIEFLRDSPEIRQINSKFQRNEGYQNSLNNEENR